MQVGACALLSHGGLAIWLRLEHGSCFRQLGSGGGGKAEWGAGYHRAGSKDVSATD